MKRLVLMFVFLSFVTGCASNYKIDGRTYKPYGLFNKEEVKDPAIEYSLCVGNLVWGSILFSTVIAPVYFFGFSLFEPVGTKPFGGK